MPVAAITHQTSMASGFVKAPLSTILRVVNKNSHPHRAVG